MHATFCRCLPGRQMQTWPAVKSPTAVCCPSGADSTLDILLHQRCVSVLASRDLSVCCTRWYPSLHAAQASVLTCNYKSWQLDLLSQLSQRGQEMPPCSGKLHQSHDVQQMGG